MIGLDFETYGSRSLPKVGLFNYVEDPYFQPLLAAVSYTDQETRIIDFSRGYERALEELDDYVVQPALHGEVIVAHNAGFERAVLQAAGFKLPVGVFYDSAVIARALGFGGSLEAAASQMLGIPKLEEGKELIKLFSMPDEEEWQRHTMLFDPAKANWFQKEWDMFRDYCTVDAVLSLRIATDALQRHKWMYRELDYAHLTMEMNATGWPVDHELLQQMIDVYDSNVEELLHEFQTAWLPGDLNLASTPQLIEWCGERGVKAKSFDERAVEQLGPRVLKLLDKAAGDDEKYHGLLQVTAMLEVKKALGGSSPKKLRKIQESASKDGRLHDQYLHLGAAATFRTTGRGVQMQNLPRLHGGGDPVSEVHDWSNDDIAHNLRQVFKAQHEDGLIIVGDFSSVESRGLAWQANEQWKLDAYRADADVYKQLAATKFGIPYNDVTKDQRLFGKVGELSCGYGAGPGAVRSFAEGMGVDLTDGEALDIVRGWRDANLDTVEYWRQLEALLHRTMALETRQSIHMEYASIEMRMVPAPDSLKEQTKNPDLRSLEYSVVIPRIRVGDANFLTRVVHGVHPDGRNISYFKPTSRKTGDLWVSTYVDPKTGLKRKYSLYGGKLAGLLTQSLCREVFFNCLTNVMVDLDRYANVQVVGQFHDEIVLEWQPVAFRAGDDRPLLDADAASTLLHDHMSASPLAGFPLAAEVNSAARYIK